MHVLLLNEKSRKPSSVGLSEDSGPCWFLPPQPPHSTGVAGVLGQRLSRGCVDGCGLCQPCFSSIDVGASHRQGGAPPLLQVCSVSQAFSLFNPSADPQSLDPALFPSTTAFSPRRGRSHRGGASVVPPQLSSPPSPLSVPPWGGEMLDVAHLVGWLARSGEGGAGKRGAEGWHFRSSVCSRGQGLASKAARGCRLPGGGAGVGRVWRRWP